MLELAPSITCPTPYLRGDREPVELYPAEESAARSLGRYDIHIVDECEHFYVGRSTSSPTSSPGGSRRPSGSWSKRGKPKTGYEDREREMRGAFHGREDVQIEDVPVPQPGAGELLLGVRPPASAARMRRSTSTGPTVYWMQGPHPTPATTGPDPRA